MAAVADYSRLRHWTPTSLFEDSELRVTWRDLSGLRFDQPFFDRRVKAYCRDNSPPTEVTGLGALAALDLAPSLDPSLIIAHSARCGSTLLARMMGSMDGVVTISEPGIVDRILVRGLRHPASFPTGQILRQAVRALGRIRLGNETRYVLKLNSSSTRFLPRFRDAFPDTPVVWLHRRPIEIVESNLRAPGRWIGYDPHGDDDLAALTLKKLSVVLLAATAHVTEDMLVLDYDDLPDAAWTKVAPFMGLTLGEAEIARMRDIAAYHSKSGRPFEPRQRMELADFVRTTTRQTLDPIYESLDRRRHARATG